MPKGLRVVLLVGALSLPLSASTCLWLAPTTDEAELAHQAKIVADVEIVYTGLAKAGAQYVHCGEPTYLPCIAGPPKPEVISELRALDNAAYSALGKAREAVSTHKDATSYTALASVAIAAYTAYEMKEQIR